MTDDKLELSRRKTLAGLGAIGAAGAGTGLGTSALFSDEESFNNNTIEAGTANLVIEASVGPVSSGLENNGSVELVDADSDSDGDDGTLTVDGTPDPAVGLRVQDMKPGDAFCLRTTVIVEGNPMFVKCFAENIFNHDGTNTEPEGQADDDVDPSSPGSAGEGDEDGELMQNLEVATGYEPERIDDDDPSSSQHHDGRFNYVDDSGTSQTASTPSDVESNVENDDVTLPITGPEFFERIAGDDDFPGEPDGDDNNGILFSGQSNADASTPGGHGGGNQTRIGGPSQGDAYDTSDNVDRHAVTTWTCFRLPLDVGNVVQGDVLTFDLRYAAEQVRNNDNGSTIDEPGCPDPRDGWIPICDWNDLDDVRNDLGEKYYLVRDLDDTSAGYDTHVEDPSGGWNPIGKDKPDDSDKPFTGRFDGDGQTIEDLKIERPTKDGVGLFARTDGMLKDVGIEGAEITGDEGVGALVGKQIGGTVRRAYASGSVSGGFSYTGGLVGSNYTDATIEESYATADVTAGRKGTDPREGENGEVTFGEYVGGLVGGIEGTVKNSYATGDVTSGGNEYDDDGVGGLVGLVSPDGKVELSYATGDVDAPDIDRGAGRLVGINKAKIRESYADSTSTVTGPNVNEGTDDLVGRNVGAGGALPSIDSESQTLATGEMQGSDASNSGNMDEFNFSSVWDTESGEYPVLQALDRQTQIDAR
jgi:predicted ribosomally synthesized peptide with SipW-like signal peptide